MRDMLQILHLRPLYRLHAAALEQIRLNLCNASQGRQTFAASTFAATMGLPFNPNQHGAGVCVAYARAQLIQFGADKYQAGARHHQVAL